MFRYIHLSPDLPRKYLFVQIVQKIPKKDRNLYPKEFFTINKLQNVYFLFPCFYCNLIHFYLFNITANLQNSLNDNNLQKDIIY